MLGKECGRCHRSDLTTGVKGALAVFDLTKDRWYDSPTEVQLRKMLLRVRGLDSGERATVECFVGYSLDGKCAVAPETGE